jgi:hypothetical protein
VSKPTLEGHPLQQSGKLTLVQSKEDRLKNVTLELRKERADALGIAGRRLKRAMEALREFDSRPPKTATSSKRRGRLLHDAAGALLGYVIQKEALGAAHNDLVTEVYGVTPEVWNLMGALHTSQDDKAH